MTQAKTDHAPIPAEWQKEPPLTQFVLDDFVPYLLNRVTNRLNHDLRDSLKPFDLTQKQWRVIAVLKAGNGRSIGELAVYTVTDHSTLSRAIAQIEAKGLVRREGRDGDARFAEVWLTEAGEAVFHQVWPIAFRHFLHSVRGLDQAEVDQFVETLHRILGNIRRSPFA